MNFYRLFDYISGIGCIVYATSFLLKKFFFLPERRLVFFFYVLGFGFIFRGLASTYGTEELRLAERFVFILFPLAATLYVERMARLKLHLFFKVYVIVGCIATFLSFMIFDSSGDFPLIFMFGYEVLTLLYLIFKLVQKVISLKGGVEKSISLCLLIFTLSTLALLCVDWHLKMHLYQERITSLIVFPFCYVAFLITFSSEGFSIKRIFSSSLFDIFFITVQAALLYAIIPNVRARDAILLFTLLLYIRMILKTFSVLFNSTENKKAHFVLEKINRLSKVKSGDFLEEVKKIDNIEDAKLLKKEDFEVIGLGEAFEELVERQDYFSRLQIEAAKLRLDDEVDLNLVQLITYTLDAFKVDFIFFVPKTSVCFGLKFEDFNLDSSLEERAYNIYTQMTLALYRSGGTDG